jgi:CBS domain-containing protein
VNGECSTDPPPWAWQVGEPLGGDAAAWKAALTTPAALARDDCDPLRSRWQSIAHAQCVPVRPRQHRRWLIQWENTMPLGSICTRELVTLDRNASLQEAARLMRDHHVGTVIVTQHLDAVLHVAGIVTDRDLAIEILARGVDGASVAVGALLRAGPMHSVPEDAELGDAIAMMEKGGVRRLLVHDADGHVAGIVSFDDVLQACAAQLAGLAGVLRRGVEQEVAQRARVAAPPRPAVRVPAVGTAGWQSSGAARAP